MKTETCTITAPANFTVTLPTVPQSSLPSLGVDAGGTKFSISVSGCTAGLTGANIYFENGINTNKSNGRLINTGTASNVELQLVDHKGYEVAMNYAYNIGQYETYTNNIQSGSAQLDFFVYYLAKGAATPGTVTSSVTYSMVYN